MQPIYPIHRARRKRGAPDTRLVIEVADGLTPLHLPHVTLAADDSLG